MPQEVWDRGVRVGAQESVIAPGGGVRPAQCWLPLHVLPTCPVPPSPLRNRGQDTPGSDVPAHGVFAEACAEGALLLSEHDAPCITCDSSHGPAGRNGSALQQPHCAGGPFVADWRHFWADLGAESGWNVSQLLKGATVRFKQGSAEASRCLHRVAQKSAQPGLN